MLKSKSVGDFSQLFSVTLSIMGLLFGIVSSSAADTPEDRSDESGTLVVLARTRTTVIVAVDSKISRHGHPINPHRKLVDVGDRSSCAIDGNLGIEGERSDIAPAMARWVRKHPHIEADVTLNDLLSAAAEAYNSRHLRPGDVMPRKAGEQILQVSCGGFSPGWTYIIRGVVNLGQDYLAHPLQIPAYGVDSFYLDGVLNTEYFFHVLAPDITWLFPPQPREKEARALSNNVIGDIDVNPLAHSVLALWQADNRRCILGKKTYYKLDCPVSNWTPVQIKILMTQIFQSVEENDGNDVARPNNVRIIDSQGRLETQVEKSWERSK
jgi:hypothetical protein